MRLIGIIFFGTYFICCAHAQDVVCSKKMRKVVRVNEGDSFSFLTQAGDTYVAKSKCQVVYRKGPACPSIKFSCAEFNLNSKKTNCKGGDKITIVVEGKSTKYCQDSGPDVMTSSKTLKVVFTSNKKKNAAGAVCTAACVIEETTTTTPTLGSTESTTAPTTIAPTSTAPTSTAPTTIGAAEEKTLPWFFGMTSHNVCVETGTTVIFDKTGSGHNVNQLGSQSDFDSCTGFADTQGNSDNPYKYQADTPGVFYFACGVGDGIHCSTGKMKAMVTVADTCPM